MNLHRLMIVKFYGPRRDPRGRLWGYSRFPDGADDVRVVEPMLGTERLPDHSIVVVEMSTPDGQPHEITGCSAWDWSREHVEVLRSEIGRCHASGHQVPQELLPLVHRLSTAMLTADFLPYCSPDQVKVWVAAEPVTYVAAVQQVAGDPAHEASVWSNVVLQAIRAVGWPAIRAFVSVDRLLEVISSLTRGSAESALRTLPIEFLAELNPPTAATVLPLCSSSQLGDWSTHAVASYLSAVRHAVDNASNTPGERLAQLLRAVTFTGWPALRAQIDHARITELLELGPETPPTELIEGLPVDFVLDVPELLRISPTAAIAFCSVALRSTTKDDRRTHPFLEHLRHLFRQCVEAPASSNLKAAATQQATVLMMLHPSIARRLNREHVLVPELAHLVGCGDDVTCLHDGTLASRLGHAVAATVRTVDDPLHKRKQRALQLAKAFVATTKSRYVDPETAAADEFFRAIVDLANTSDILEHVGALSRMLPPCNEGITPFCEAKPPSAGYSDPLCPRTGRGCAAGICRPNYFQRAIEDWSLIEVLGTAVTPRDLDLSGKTFVNTVAGWVNRLLELRERMVCERCDAVLVVDPKYALKYDARYAATVVRCSRDCGSAGVYLNHCFHCHHIIDSRESPFRHNGRTGELLAPGMGQYEQREGWLHLCIHCANKMEPYCPRCGAPAESGSHLDTRICSGCGHRVQLSARDRQFRQVHVDFRHEPWTFSLPAMPDHPAWNTDPSRAPIAMFAGAGQWRRRLQQDAEPF